MLAACVWCIRYVTLVWYYWIWSLGIHKPYWSGFQGTISEFRREIKFPRCLFTFSIKSEIRHFHLIVVQKRKRNVQKNCDGRAKLMFCLLFFLVDVLVVVVCYTAVFSVVTQRSSPLKAAENRTTFLSRDKPIRIQLPFSRRCSRYVAVWWLLQSHLCFYRCPMYMWMTAQSKPSRENKQSTRVVLW